MTENEEYTAKLALRKTIITIAKELELNADLLGASIKGMDKNALIENFCAMKELRLSHENNRLIELIIAESKKIDLECGNCQREDASCEYCIRNEENTDKEDPDLKDLYYHEAEVGV